MEILVTIVALTVLLCSGYSQSSLGSSFSVSQSGSDELEVSSCVGTLSFCSLSLASSVDLPVDGILCLLIELLVGRPGIVWYHYASFSLVESFVVASLSKAVIG